MLTERTDVIVWGGFRSQFWVCGRFDVHDGKITLWRDAFDFVDIVRGSIRGLIGLVAPGLAPRHPPAAMRPGGSHPLIRPGCAATGAGLSRWDRAEPGALA